MAIDFFIRPVETNELSSILGVYQQCEDFLVLGPVASASSEMVLADLQLSKNEGGSYCGIYEQSSHKMIGVVDFVAANYKGNPRHAYLELLMIMAAYRRHGLGAAVVDLVEKEILKNLEIVLIKAGVQVNNPLAISFWLKQGYKITSGPIDYPDQTTVYNLEKEVRS